MSYLESIAVIQGSHRCIIHMERDIVICQLWKEIFFDEKQVDEWHARIQETHARIDQAGSKWPEGYGNVKKGTS